MGAWTALVIIVLSPKVTGRDLIEEWQVVVMVAIMVVSIVAYGAFIFDRALAVSALARAGKQCRWSLAMFLPFRTRPGQPPEATEVQPTGTAP